MSKMSVEQALLRVEALMSLQAVSGIGVSGADEALAALRAEISRLETTTFEFEVVQAIPNGDCVAGEYGIAELADARLIAAAPDLLAALELVRDYIVTMKGRGHEYQVEVDAAIDAARQQESSHES